MLSSVFLCLETLMKHSQNITLNSTIKKIQHLVNIGIHNWLNHCTIAPCIWTLVFKTFYTISNILCPFWVIAIYDLLEDRCINDINVNVFTSLSYGSFINLMLPNDFTERGFPLVLAHSPMQLAKLPSKWKLEVTCAVWWVEFLSSGNRPNIKLS